VDLLAYALAVVKTTRYLMKSQGQMQHEAVETLAGECREELAVLQERLETRLGYHQARASVLRSEVL